MIIQSIKKELQLVFSDLHSVAVLFIMPLIFMVIMTLALGEKQSDVIKQTQISIQTKGLDDNQKLFLAYFSAYGYDLGELDGSSNASIAFTRSFDEGLFEQRQQAFIDVHFSDDLSPQLQNVIIQHLKMAFSKLKLNVYLLDGGEIEEDMSRDEQMAMVDAQTNTEGFITIAKESKTQAVTMHSIPSWLIFGIYFIVLPISTTLLNELKNGTLIRLKTFPINLSVYYINKLFAFYLISLGQFLVLSLIGLRLIPLLVDMPPVPYSHIVSLLPSSLLICFAAVCFAGIIASLVNTYEQAIVLGGGINIIMAALSGFMVPLDIMPASLQVIATYSPMYWSADIVRSYMVGAEFVSTIPSLLSIIVFSGICAVFALLLFSRKSRNLLWN